MVNRTNGSPQIHFSLTWLVSGVIWILFKDYWHHYAAVISIATNQPLHSLYTFFKRVKKRLHFAKTNNTFFQTPLAHLVLLGPVVLPKLNISRGKGIICPYNWLHPACRNSATHLVSTVSIHVTVLIILLRFEIKSAIIRDVSLNGFF